MTAVSWGFYGRRQELEHLASIIKRGRWFFVKIAGRRRIGKTSLIQEAIKKLGRERVVYVQIPDSDPAGVISSANDFLAGFGVTENLPTDMRSLAKLVSDLVLDGRVVVLDEFQYFHRAALYDFTSFLQAEVDHLAARAQEVPGGLIVLGSLHTELTSILEDRSAPLFNRITDQLDLPHLDVASVLEILRTHADDDPMRLLFLWNLFEGVPKFYRDCYEQGVLGAGRSDLLETMFFRSSSPLRTEADNWFLRELRGRYDLVLKFIARKPGCTHAEIAEHAKSMDPSKERQVGGYIKNLRDKFQMIERLLPIFAKPTARNGRFYLRDNFLRSWLAALAVPAASINFRPMERLLLQADERLAEAEGSGFERLVSTLYAERSRKGIGDFELTEEIRGYWDRAGTEIDMVALSEKTRTIRFGSCKRNPERLVRNTEQFDGHVYRFLALNRSFEGWTVEKVGLSPHMDDEQREFLRRAGYIPQDLTDLTREL
jgi:uncharacterized protein